MGHGTAEVRVAEDRESNGRTRRARPEEAGLLSVLARRSKAHWGYDPQFLEACRAELTLSPDFIAGGEVWVLEADSRILGFYSLAKWHSQLELAHFFVDPERLGEGTGRSLWLDAVQRSASLGHQRLLIQSDPHAEGFYLKLGAERIGEVPSQVQQGRMLPLLLYQLTDGQP
jgi:GNAT superfamily N-acetyltransferase